MRLLLAAVTIALAASAFASHDEPAKAKKFQASLVNSFAPCDSPDTRYGATGGVVDALRTGSGRIPPLTSALARNDPLPLTRSGPRDDHDCGGDR